MYKISPGKPLSVSEARKAFREVLAKAERQPVSIHRHGKPLAIVGPPSLLSGERDERQKARDDQQAVELARLSRHQALAIRLLVDPEQASHLVEKAKAVVDQWEINGACSGHFIDRWRKLLALPIRELAMQMCGECEGWGSALRQNSPWRFSRDA